jgi:RimJ/RimL family protein N-acetyltransferase
MSELRTDRLLLRHWRESDLVPWAALNADPEVREYFPGLLTSEESEASTARFQADLDRRGWGWWAVEVRATGEFIGFAGLDPVDEGMPFSGVEAGWRLARTAWATVMPPRPSGPPWPSASTTSGSRRSSR